MDPINEFFRKNADTKFGRACADSKAMDLIGARGFYEIIAKPLFKRVLPFCVAVYLGAIGLQKGDDWITENTEFGRRLSQLEERIAGSDYYKGFSEACNAIGSMR